MCDSLDPCTAWQCTAWQFPLLAQALAGSKSHHRPHGQNEMSQAAAHQHVLPQARTTLWEITLGKPVRQLPGCTEVTSLPENSSVCLSPSLPAHPPYSWMTINNAPYRSARLALILYEGVVESVDSIIDGPWCGVVLQSLQKELGEPACTSRALVEERENMGLAHEPRHLDFLQDGSQ